MADNTEHGIKSIVGEDIVIRPSSLGGWSDCPRRAAAGLFKSFIERMGYKLREREPNIGAAVGSAVHRGAEYLMRHKMAEGTLGSVADGMEVAVEEFKVIVADGMNWDTETPNRSDGERQIERMVAEYGFHVAPTIEPAHVEKRFECNLGDGFLISGQEDAATREPRGIHDLKTGKMRRSNAAQFGAYSLILTSHGEQPEYLREDFIQRVAVRRPQPKPEQIDYNPAVCEEYAFDTIMDMKAALIEFGDSLKNGKRAPENAFRANPMSMLCSPKYCEAWGTDFCRVHKGAFTKEKP